MKRYAPLLTVVAVAVLGAALFLASSAVDPARQEAPAAAASAAPASAAGTAPGTETPAAAVDPPAVAETAWVGRSSGNEVTVAIAVLDGRAVAYVCDGDQIEAWLEGTLEGDRLTLQGADGATLTGTADEAATFGEVSVGGAQWPYSAQVVQAPEGLYEGRANIDGVANRIGWIVLDGTQVGIRDAGGTPVPAPRLDPTDLDGVVVDGVPVQVRTITGADRVVGQ